MEKTLSGDSQACTIPLIHNIPPCKLSKLEDPPKRNYVYGMDKLRSTTGSPAIRSDGSRHNNSSSGPSCSKQAVTSLLFLVLAFNTLGTEAVLGSSALSSPIITRSFEKLGTTRVTDPLASVTDHRDNSARLPTNRFRLCAYTTRSLVDWTVIVVYQALSKAIPQLRWVYRGLLDVAMPILICIVILLRAQLKKSRRQLARAEQHDSELTRSVRTLKQLTLIDPLTGIANRRQFDLTLEREYTRMMRDRSCISVIFVDVDHFKLVNDSLGHRKGDEYLIRVAAQLSASTFRPADLVARIGGEEFVLILPDTDEAGAVKVAERLRGAVMGLRLPHLASPTESFLTISLGVATTSEGVPHILLACADRALYAAKLAGRNRVVAHSQLSALPTDVSEMQMHNA